MELSEILLELTLVIIGIVTLLHITVDLFSKMPKKWRDFLFLVLAIWSLWVAYSSLKQRTDIEGPLNRQTTAINSMMEAQEQRIIDSLKFRLNVQDTLLANIQNTQDTILVKIALLDTCIDKHFWSVNRRLSDIESLLSP